MTILFLTIGAVYNFDSSGAYTDLLKRFAKERHDVYVVGAIEKRTGKETQLTTEHGINVLRVRVGNITKTNIIEKGISTLTIASRYQHAILKYWKNIIFDLIIYTTPPITIAGLVAKLKKKYNAYTYLLLKDIFPQNAIDLGILTKKGWRGLAYLYFKKVESHLYAVSDKIGCMSQANVDYIRMNNKNIPNGKLEICPNTIDVIQNQEGIKNDEILKKYNIPIDKYLLLYGGNFGKPQNVDFIINAIDGCSEIKNIHFILCGSGTDFYKIEKYMMLKQPKHVTVIHQLPYDEYTKIVASCNIGLLFLDYRFTIPNFPSRLLDYMNYGLPVIAATDVNSDVGKTIEAGNFGWWVKSNTPSNFIELVKKLFDARNISENLIVRSQNAREYLQNEFETGIAYSKIIKSCDKNVTLENIIISEDS